MGFEDNKDALGFEDDQLDLDGDADLSMGTGRVRAQRKKGIKTEEVAFARPKRDRFGRRGDGEESGEGADMLNPDKPTRISGGFSRREMTPQEVKPLQSENSKFAYLFSEDEEDEDEVSTVAGKRSAVEALSMKGDEADAANVFERENRSVIHSQGKPQRRSEPAEQPVQRSSGTGRFSRRSENTENEQKPAPSRFARRSAAAETAPKAEKEEPAVMPEPIAEVVNIPVKEETYTAPVIEEPVAEEPAPAPESEAESAVYADTQAYGYGNPYMYGQYPNPYPPYGGYPQQNPYMQPYGQPYGQQPYPPYQYPANYAQPQYIPVGYVFQAGFVPVELAHGTPQRRRRPSAARAAHRYDQTPEAGEEMQPAREARRVRAIAAKQEQPAEPAAEAVPQHIPEPAPEPAIVEVSPEPVVREEPAATYETQYDRIAAEIPEEPEAAPAVEFEEEKKESTTPSRFARRGSSERPSVPETGNEERPAPSRFAARGSSARSTSAPTDSGAAPSAPSGGGRFNRRG